MQLRPAYDEQCTPAMPGSPVTPKSKKAPRNHAEEGVIPAILQTEGDAVPNRLALVWLTGEPGDDADRVSATENTTYVLVTADEDLRHWGIVTARRWSHGTDSGR